MSLHAELFILAFTVQFLRYVLRDPLLVSLMNLGVCCAPLQQFGTSVVTITWLVQTSLCLLQVLPICHVAVNGGAHWSLGTHCVMQQWRQAERSIKAACHS